MEGAHYGPAATELTSREDEPGRVMAFCAVVTDIREERRMEGRVLWQVHLDWTEFRGGDVGTLKAVARSGARLEIPVLSVVVNAVGEVWHVVEKPLSAGTPVTGEVERGAV